MRVVEVASLRAQRHPYRKRAVLVVVTGRRHPALMESVEGIVLFLMVLPIWETEEVETIPVREHIW